MTNFFPSSYLLAYRQGNSRAEKVRAVITYGALRRGCPYYVLKLMFPPHLPRAPGDGDIAGRPWRDCHNSAASFATCAAGFPLKSVGGREKVSLSPALSSRPGVPLPGLRLALIARTACPSPPKAVVLAARLTRYHAGFVPAIPSIQFSWFGEGSGKACPSPITRK